MDAVYKGDKINGCDPIESKSNAIDLIPVISSIFIPRRKSPVCGSQIL